MKQKLLFIAAVFALAFAAPDARAQWQLMNGKGGCIVYSIVADGTNLFAATNDGLILSTDSGHSWTVVDSGLTNGSVMGLAWIDSTLFVGAGGGRSNDTGNSGVKINFIGFTSYAVMGSILFGAVDNGVARSTDSGMTWTACGFTQFPYYDAFQGHDVYSLAASGGRVYAGTEVGVFLSLDTGKTWGIPDGYLPDSNEVLSLVVKGGNLYAGTDTNGIYITPIKSTFWSRVDNNRTALRRITALVWNGSEFWVGTDSGVFVSTDSGINWTSRNSGLRNLNVQCLTFAGTTLFAGTRGDGIFSSTDSGASWVSCNAGLTGLYIRTLQFSQNTLFAGMIPGNNYYQGEPVCSTDEGITWNCISPNTGAGANNVTAFDSIGNNLLIAMAFSGVYLSNDDGETWIPVDSGLENNTLLSFATMGTFVFASSLGGVYLSTDSGASWVLIDSQIRYTENFAIIGSIIFLGTEENGVFRSMDSGKHWSQVNNGLSDTNVFTLVVIGNKLFAGTQNGVFLSTDSARTWESVSNGLPDGVYVFHFASIGTNLFASVDGGVYYTNDFGANWISVSDGLPPELTYEGGVQYFAIDSFYLFAAYATEYGAASGVYRRSLSEMIVPASISTTPLTQQSITSYPNPFTQSTTITLTTPASGVAELSVVNLLGEEVARLYDGELGAGEHSFTWNANGFPPGTYWCVMRSNGLTQELPMVLSR
jgi:photosystem II stability/assembly factor-like uncharacterized protein